MVKIEIEFEGASGGVTAWAKVRDDSGDLRDLDPPLSAAGQDSGQARWNLENALDKRYGSEEWRES